MQSVTSLEVLLADLEKRQIRLWVDGERLRYNAPKGAVTPALREQLQEHKADLIAWLRRRRTYPPSFAQRRFWTLQRLNPDAAFYNVPFAFRLCGPLDVAILRRSFDAVVRRHEVLRTTLQELSGELMQVVAPTGEINLATAGAAEPGAVRPMLEAEMLRPFDLASEAGLRVFLLQAGDHEHFLQLCFHNTLYDQSSVMVLLDEVSLHYAAFRAGETAVLPPPAQYAEYARWQETLPATEVEARVNYWRDWFSAGDPPAWRWTPHKPAPATPTFHTHTPTQSCTPELTRQLKALSQRNGVTAYITLLTAYAIILRHYTGCPDITIGTTYSNRHHWQFASLIGATIDVPALRIDMTGDPDLATLLARVRTVVTAALTHQDVPFERIASRGPLFRVVFTFFPETPHRRLQLPGVTVTYLEDVVNELSRPDLYLVFWENHTDAGDALTGYWMHKKDVFEADTAERMNLRFQALLAAMVNRPMGTVEEFVSTIAAH